eukprot:766973-Hanusia_phi.AAC.4
MMTSHSEVAAPLMIIGSFRVSVYSVIRDAKFQVDSRTGSNGTAPIRQSGMSFRPKILTQCAGTRSNEGR